MLHREAWWLDGSVSGGHAASIFRVEERGDREVDKGVGRICGRVGIGVKWRDSVKSVGGKSSEQDLENENFRVDLYRIFSSYGLTSAGVMTWLKLHE
jgi:hypothetical protein